jgi:hypothetical protein
MEGERRRRQVLQRQARELVYKVFSYLKREADADMPVHDVAKAQGRTVEACDFSIESVQRIINEGSVTLCIAPCTPPSFVRVGHLGYCPLGANVRRVKLGKPAYSETLATFSEVLNQITRRGEGDVLKILATEYVSYIVHHFP